MKDMPSAEDIIYNDMWGENGERLGERITMLTNNVDAKGSDITYIARYRDKFVAMDGYCSLNNGFMWNRCSEVYEVVPHNGDYVRKEMLAQV